MVLLSPGWRPWTDLDMITVEAKLGCRSQRTLAKIAEELRRRLVTTVEEPPPARMQVLCEALTRRIADTRRNRG